MSLRIAAIYSRKTKSRVLMFCTIFFILFSLNMQHHSMQLSGPPHESPQLAVSIRHQADLAPRECGFHRVPLGGKQAQTADDQPQPENSDRSSSSPVPSNPEIDRRVVRCARLVCA